MSKDKNYRAFLSDLKELTVKHGVVIGGCGCCGSPWLMTAPKNPEEGFYRYRDEDFLQFIHPSDEYNWEKHGGEKP